MQSPATAQSPHVVILALDTLGDLVLRQPLFSELLDRQYSVTVVARPGYVGIVPYLDIRLQTLTIDIDPYGIPDAAERSRLIDLATAIDRAAPDMLVAAAYNRTYAEEWILHQFPRCVTIGFARPDEALDRLPSDAQPRGIRRRELLTRAVTCPVEDHEADKQRALFQAIAGVEMPKRLPRIALDEAQREAAAGLARGMGLEPGKYVFGCPAGTMTVRLKAWPVDQFVEIAGRVLARHQLPTLLAGVGSEASLLRAIADAGDRSGVRCPVWIGDRDNVGALLGLIANSRVYLGNDSGPMHCAAALGVPVVARFGGGHWPRFLPLGHRTFAATQLLPCFGCEWRCWLDAPACMTTVRSDTFVEGVDWALASNDEDRRVDVGTDPDSRWAETLAAAATLTRRLRAEIETSRSHGATRVAPVDRGRAPIKPAVSGPAVASAGAAAPVSRLPKVFVVTPSFNQGRYLRETIESVLSQDYENLEYFVSDGGSTDNSQEILRSFGTRVRWRSGPDGGQAAAIARAWAASDAEVVAWLNSDDTYLPGAVSSAVEYLQDHPEAAMVYGRAWYTNAVGRRLRPYPTRSFDRKVLAGECFICQPAAFVRREVFQVVDLPDVDLRYCMDYDLWIRISRHFQVGYLEQFLATSRLHPENKTLGQQGGAIREAMLVGRRHFGSFHPNWLLLDAQRRVAELCARSWLPSPSFQRWRSGRVAHKAGMGLERSPYDDGWAGPRTIVQVEADDSGVASLDIWFPIWPYPGIVRITASCGNQVLAVRHVRGPCRTTMALRLPKSSPRRAAVVLEANRAFVPFVRYCGSSDSRILSFAVRPSRAGHAVSAADLRLSDRLARLSRLLGLLPTRLRQTACGALARLHVPPAEAEPYDDGWVGLRATVRVDPDRDRAVTLGCECVFWPYEEPLRVKVFHKGRVLAEKTAGVGPFVLSFTLPPGTGPGTTVLCVANRSFVPSDHGVSPDLRPLSFRFLDFEAASAEASGTFEDARSYVPRARTG